MLCRASRREEGAQLSGVSDGSLRRALCFATAAEEADEKEADNNGFAHTHSTLMTAERGWRGARTCLCTYIQCLPDRYILRTSERMGTPTGGRVVPLFRGGNVCTLRYHLPPLGTRQASQPLSPCMYGWIPILRTYATNGDADETRRLPSLGLIVGASLSPSGGPPCTTAVVRGCSLGSHARTVHGLPRDIVSRSRTPPSIYSAKHTTPQRRLVRDPRPAMILNLPLVCLVPALFVSLLAS